MAVHFPTTLFELDTIRLPLSQAKRLEMEQAIEDAIALLDQEDGDCDLEDDELGDDSLDALGEDPRFAETALVYGIDQSRGPDGFGAYIPKWGI